MESTSVIPMSSSDVPAVITYISLYVGDLDISVSEAQLTGLFGRFEGFESAKLCTDQIDGLSRGYGYANYRTLEQAKHALEMMNYTTVNGKPIRVMLSDRDPSTRSKKANIFIKNLDPAIDSKALHKVFVSSGNVLSCKVATDSNGQSKGFAFVQFEHEETAQKAIQQHNGTVLNDREVYVGPFVGRQERDGERGSQKFKNIYINNLSETCTYDSLKEEFERFGPISSAVIMRDEIGNSKGFGFVCFEDEDAAAAAVENVNGKSMNDKILYVGRAQKRSEREVELKANFEQERAERMKKHQGANLYLKNLDDSLCDDKLTELFSPFGEIISCKVMLDSQGQSKGFGFVQFTSPEEANHAINQMNGKMIEGKPIYVAIAQRKEERVAKLQAHFSQLNIQSPMATTPTPSVPVYHPDPPRPARPPLYYGQGPQGAPGLMMPRTASFGFPQQLFPGIWPGAAPSFITPYPVQRPGQAGQSTGIRRGRIEQPQIQQPQPVQLNANNAVGPSMRPQGLMVPMMLVPLDARSMKVAPVDADRSPSIPISSLASTLVSAPHEQQRRMLGEQLYPPVAQLVGDQAGKVTGMLLEMDHAEVLHLIESPDALQKKVKEAMEVLKNSAATHSEDAALE